MILSPIGRVEVFTPIPLPERPVARRPAHALPADPPCRRPGDAPRAGASRSPRPLRDAFIRQPGRPKRHACSRHGHRSPRPDAAVIGDRLLYLRPWPELRGIDMSWESSDPSRGWRRAVWQLPRGGVLAGLRLRQPLPPSPRPWPARCWPASRHRCAGVWLANQGIELRVPGLSLDRELRGLGRRAGPVRRGGDPARRLGGRAAPGMLMRLLVMPLPS